MLTVFWRDSPHWFTCVSAGTVETSRASIAEQLLFSAILRKVTWNRRSNWSENWVKVASADSRNLFNEKKTYLLINRFLLHAWVGRASHACHSLRSNDRHCQYQVKCDEFELKTFKIRLRRSSSSIRMRLHAFVEGVHKHKHTPPPITFDITLLLRHYDILILNAECNNEVGVIQWLEVITKSMLQASCTFAFSTTLALWLKSIFALSHRLHRSVHHSTCYYISK